MKHKVILKQIGFTILTVLMPWVVSIPTFLYWRPENLPTLMQNASIIILGLLAPILIGILITNYDKSTKTLRSVERKVIANRIFRGKYFIIQLATVIIPPFVIGGDNWLWLEVIVFGYWSFIMVWLVVLLTDSFKWALDRSIFMLGYFAKRIETDSSTVTKSFRASLWGMVNDGALSLKFEEKMGSWVDLWKSDIDVYRYNIEGHLFGYFCRDVNSLLSSENEGQLRVVFLAIREFSDNYDKRNERLKAYSEQILPELEEWHDKLENMHELSGAATEKLSLTKQSLSTLMTELKAEAAKQKQADSADEQADSSAAQTD